MAVTGSIVGRESAHVYLQAGTWGTEITGTYQEWLLEDDGLDFSQELDPIEENASVWLKDDDLGTHSVSFAPREGLKFDQLHGIFSVLGDGNYATPAEANASKDDWTHTAYPDEDNNGDFDTIGIKKGSYIHALTAVKFFGFAMSGQAAPNNIKVTYDTLVRNITNASTVITASTFTGTNPLSGNGGRVFFKNFAFYIADQSATTALTATDAISNVISSFEFIFRRSVTEDRSNTSGLYIEEPVEDGYPEATLTLELNNLDSDIDTFITNHLANTEKMLKFEITGAVASSATGTVATASIKVEAPRAVVTEVSPGPYGGPGRIGSRVTFKLNAADTTSDAEGMAFVEPFKLTAICGQSAKFIS